jgi:hypothetical protein
MWVSNIQSHSARWITRLRTRGMRWTAGKCLHWHLTLSLTKSNTYMFQVDHYIPCAQERQGNLSKW